jgi:hypothetical protein
VPSTRVWAPYPNTTPEGRTALASGRIYHLYPTVRGEQRLAARSLETGVLEYDVAVPWLDYGSAVDAVSAESGEMFIVANQSLFVIEGATGQLKKTIVTL